MNAAVIALEETHSASQPIVPASRGALWYRPQLHIESFTTAEPGCVILLLTPPARAMCDVECAHVGEINQDFLNNIRVITSSGISTTVGIQPLTNRPAWSKYGFPWRARH